MRTFTTSRGLNIESVIAAPPPAAKTFRTTGNETPVPSDECILIKDYLMLGALNKKIAACHAGLHRPPIVINLYYMYVHVQDPIPECEV